MGKAMRQFRMRKHQRGFIYLTTGANGTGKTLLTLKDVRAKQLAENRPVYYCNIILAGEALNFGWIEADIRDWQSFPPGSIILGDEAHKYFPKRSGQNNVPAHVEGVAEHRKDGYDFFLITQHPADLDVFIRRRVASPGWHRHLKRKGASEIVSVLEFNTVKDDPEKQGTSATALISTVGYPREVYSWYRSADLHTAKFKIPKQVIFIGAALVAVIGLLIGGVYMFQNQSPAGKAMAKKAADPAAPVPPVIRQAPGKDSTMSTAEYVASFQPRIAGLEHTAPMYDGLTSPVKVPVPAACLDWAKRGCKCFTQEGTLYQTTADICKQIAKSGIFLAFQSAEKTDKKPKSQDASRRESGSPPPPLPDTHAAPVAPSGAYDGAMLASMKSGDRIGPR